MSDRTRPNPRALAAARLLENYAHTAQAALNHITNELRAIDWHPETSGSWEHDPVTGGNAYTSAVERSVTARLHLQAQADQINDDITTITELIASALTVANTTLGTRAPRDKPVLCDSTGREGAIEWANPTCINLPVRGPLCAACYQREYRWRRTRELPTRDDGFAA